jgi:hypothetical protein
LRRPLLNERAVRWLRWAAVASLLLSVVLTALWTRHWRVVNDAAQLDYCVFMMDHGFAPYRQLFEMNMPGIYMTNWTVMHTLGGGGVAWHLFDAGLMALLTLAMVAITRAAAQTRDWFAGLFGGVLFALFHARDGAGQMGQRDLIIAVLLIAGYAFLFESLRRASARWMFGFGLCLGAAATIKPTPLPFGFVLLTFAAIRWRTLGCRKIAAPVLAGLAGIALPLLAVLAFLVHFHAVHAFAYILRVLLPYYSPLARITWAALSMDAFTPSLMTFLLLASAIALLLRSGWSDWEHGMVLLGVFFGMASYYAQHKGFNYHRYPMLAFLFLWIGMQFAAGLRRYQRPLVQALAAIGILFGAVTAPLYAAKARRIEWPEQFPTALAADLNRLGGAQKLQGKVQCLYTMAECDTTLYRMKIVQATGLMYDFFLFQPDNARPVRDARQYFWNQIQAKPPLAIVVGRGAFPRGPLDYDKLAAWPQFAQFLQDRYVIVDQQKLPRSEGGPLGFRLYVLRNELPAQQNFH